MSQKSVKLTTDGGQWDETTILTNNPEALVIMQNDETYSQHQEIHLSPLMVSELIYVLRAWQLEHSETPPTRTFNGIPTPPNISGG